MTAGAVSYAQPSVTKVGGITEYLRVAALADEMGVKLAPHSPYFGPGFLATLQLMSLRDDGTFVEVFYMNRAACLWGGHIDADANGTIAVPEGPGLATNPTKKSWSATARHDDVANQPASSMLQVSGQDNVAV
jgi:L-alanine-DL-glutamate epimerase-like enolase superfamily enzyme